MMLLIIKIITIEIKYSLVIEKVFIPTGGGGGGFAKIELWIGEILTACVWSIIQLNSQLNSNLKTQRYEGWANLAHNACTKPAAQ